MAGRQKNTRVQLAGDLFKQLFCNYSKSGWVTKNSGFRITGTSLLETTTPSCCPTNSNKARGKLKRITNSENDEDNKELNNSK